MSDPVIPRPLHNRDGTIRSLARQMLADMGSDENGLPLTLNTTVESLTLRMLLERLCEALDTTGGTSLSPPVRGMMDDRSRVLAAPESNPNLAYFRAAADRDEDCIGQDEPAEC